MSLAEKFFKRSSQPPVIESHISEENVASPSVMPNRIKIIGSRIPYSGEFVVGHEEIHRKEIPLPLTPEMELIINPATSQD